MFLPCESLDIAKRRLSNHSFVLFFPRPYIAVFSSIYCYFIVYILLFPIPYSLITCHAEMHICEKKSCDLGLQI